MDDQLPFRRAWQYGALALLVPTLLGLGVRLSGFGMEIAFGLLILGSIGSILVVILSLPRSARAMTVAAIILMVTAPLAAVILARGQAAGAIMRVATGQAATHRLAAGFVFTDGSTPRLDQQETVTIAVENHGSRAPISGSPSRGGDNLSQFWPSTLFTYAVAPVVPPGWTPQQPVSVVAVEAETSNSSARTPGTGHWAAPGGLLRRLSDAQQMAAIRQALDQRGLIAAHDLVVGHWVPSLGWARAGAVLPSLGVLGGALVLWTGMLLLARRRPKSLTPSQPHQSPKPRPPSTRRRRR